MEMFFADDGYYNVETPEGVLTTKLELYIMVLWVPLGIWGAQSDV